MKVMVLGHTGMLGNLVCDYLRKLDDVSFVTTKYRWPTDLRIVNVGTQYFEKVLSRELQASRFKQEGLSVAELRNLGSYGLYCRFEIF